MDREDMQLIHNFIGNMNGNLMDYALTVVFHGIEKQQIISYRQRLTKLYAKLERELSN